MQTLEHKTYIRNLARNRQGQSLMLALIVMFALAFIGALFLTLLSRNIERSRQGGETINADSLSETGIRFASDQLTYGDQLADWRPMPQYSDIVTEIEDLRMQSLRGTSPFTITKADHTTVVSYPTMEDALEGYLQYNPADAPATNDPDYNWLAHGFCRYTYGTGRFLLRVTYNPLPNDPLSKYVKIECVGRTGLVDAADPTTMIGQKYTGATRMKVAYKAIGITDYARFITNKDHQSGDFALGATGTFGTATVGSPGTLTTFPAITSFGTEEIGLDSSGNPVATIHGDPIQVNGNLMWYGTNYIFLQPERGDAVEVAGDIKYAAIPYDTIGISSIGTDLFPVPQTAQTTAQWVYLIDHTTDPANPGTQIPFNQQAFPTLDSAAAETTNNGPGRNCFDTFPTQNVGLAGSLNWPNMSAQNDSNRVGLGVGNYRDGRSDNDIHGYPRRVVRLEPPILDAVQMPGSFNAYRDMTQNSGTWTQTNDSAHTPYNTGYYGVGDGLYINNPLDIQPESASYTLRGDWTTPGGSQWWVGPYYTPPGVCIELSPYNLRNIDPSTNNPYTAWSSGTVYVVDKVVTDTTTPPGYAYVCISQTSASDTKAPSLDPIHWKLQAQMVITHDSGPGQPEFYWYSYDKSANTINKLQSGEQIIIPYPKNGVIFAEGNIRIKGTLPNRANLTVVSGGTIYVEGNILKYPYDPAGRSLPEEPNILPSGSTDIPSLYEHKNSSIALLATDYVCVNTTRFFGPTREVLMANTGNDYFSISPDKSFYMNFAFGSDTVYDQINTTKYSNNPSTAADKTKYQYWDSSASTWNPVPVDLYLRHGADPDKAGVSYMNLLINYNNASGATYDPRYNFGTILNPYTYKIGDPALGWQCNVFQLWIGPPTGTASGGYNWFNQPGLENHIGFRIDQTMAIGGVQDYLLSRAAVQPCDIRIEALMYAQNKSFFVIPGEWFNPNPGDTRDYFAQNGSRPPGVDPAYPFYGQPLDVRITLYGAISENAPASIGDASAWMEKWGWIPRVHGSSTDISHVTAGYREPLDPNLQFGTANDYKNALIRRGLTMMYDGQLSNPYWVYVVQSNGTSTSTLLPMRMDQYNRVQPATPRLPVSTQILFMGDKPAETTL